MKASPNTANGANADPAPSTANGITSKREKAPPKAAQGRAWTTGCGPIELAAKAGRKDRRVAGKFMDVGNDEGLGLHPDYANLGSAALLAKRDSVFHGCTTVCTGMFHGTSRYRSAQNRSKEGTGKCTGWVRGAPGILARRLGGPRARGRSLSPGLR